MTQAKSTGRMMIRRGDENGMGSDERMILRQSPVSTSSSYLSLASGSNASYTPVSGEGSFYHESLRQKENKRGIIVSRNNIMDEHEDHQHAMMRQKRGPYISQTSVSTLGIRDEADGEDEKGRMRGRIHRRFQQEISSKYHHDYLNHGHKSSPTHLQMITTNGHENNPGTDTHHNTLRARDQNNKSQMAGVNNSQHQQQLVTKRFGLLVQKDQYDEDDSDLEFGMGDLCSPCVTMFEVSVPKGSPEYLSMRIDAFSRILIPLIFLLFCAYYWPTLLQNA